MQMALYDRAGNGAKAGEAGRAGEGRTAGTARRARTDAPRAARVCAACREREARYGFRDREDDDPTIDRPKTLCFDCFRMEMDRRRAAAEQLARGWNATQAELPLATKLEDTGRRRRRAQIAARQALGLR